MGPYIPPSDYSHQIQAEQIQAQQEEQKLWREQQEQEEQRRREELDRQNAAEIANRMEQTSQNR